MDPAPEPDLQRSRKLLESRFGDSLVTLTAFGRGCRDGRPESDLDLLVVIRGLPRRRVDRRRVIGPLAHEVRDTTVVAFSPTSPRVRP